MPSDLADELIGIFRAGVGEPLEDHRFNELALRVFRHQCRGNAVYRRFARGRGVTETHVRRWEEIPPVPTAAFKELVLVSGDPAQVQKVFRTSGTTGGRGGRGEHHVLDLRLYHESLVPNFRAHLLPEGRRLPIVSLIPAPEDLPDSSLSHMAGRVAALLGAPGGGWFVHPREGIRMEQLREALTRASDEKRPVLVLATSFALVHLVDEMAARDWAVGLPEGSRIMETGGFKGLSRTLAPEELRERVHERLGVPAGRIVNEYGMTELLSQFYEPILVEEPPVVRRLVPPPWVRTQVLDPVTLEPLPSGGEGLLCHLDLANLGSVCRVLTEDVGLETGEGGFRIVGRVQGAEPRGCSLAMDELLSARDATS